MGVFRSRRRPSPALRALVRASAATAVAASVVLPPLRRRLRLPAALTIAANVAGPVGLAVLRPRTKLRDAGIFALQMWAFTMIHEVPYDDPERLRSRLRVRYPITADLRLGRGELPSLRLQRALARPGRTTALDRALVFVHWAWFFEPHLNLVWILVRRNDRFGRSARQLATVFDIGCAIYFLVPTAPPWWAAESGEMEAELHRFAEPAQSGEAEAEALELRRMMVEVGEEVWGDAWPRMYEAFGGNPWAAMPSLHFATSLLAAMLVAEASPGLGVAASGYAAALGLALVYLGEHYAIDLIAGAALVAAVRVGEPLLEPAALRLSDAIQRLERIANS